MEEVWKDIQGYEGLYQVSNLGNVKSLNYRNTKEAKLLVPKCNNRGRLWVELINNKQRKPILVHTLVAKAFIPNPNNYCEINHIDENPKNNIISNLEWCTRQYNVNEYWKHHKKERKKFGFYKNHKWANKSINQFDMCGNLVCVWKNANEVERQQKFRACSIIACCQNKLKTSYGFIWQFAD